MLKPCFGTTFGPLVAIVAFTTIAAAVATQIAGLHVGNLWQPAMVVAMLAVLAWIRPAFRFCLSSLAILVAFSTAFSTLIYALGASSIPLADPALAMFESFFGVDSHSLAMATASHPIFAKLMFVVYFSVIPQTIVMLVWLGFRNDERLSQFLCRFMICGLVTAACFYVVPALGTSTEVNLPAIGDLIALRSGELRTISWQSVKGIVAFPSFHVVWAILLTLAMPSYPLVLLNLLVIVSTVTTGGHYLIDLVGGALICAIVVPITNRQLAVFHLNTAKRAL
jgi:hypothetical protein